jgi:hypothetical protein
MPTDKEWIKNLVNIISSDEKIAAVASNNILPKEIWETYNFWEKIATSMTVEHIGKGLCTKGDIYRKSILEKIGLFDSKTYKNTSEDSDIALKLQLEGYKIISGLNYEKIPTVLHLHGSHNTKLIKFLKKYLQFGEGMGAFTRKWKLKIFTLFRKDFIKQYFRLVSFGLIVPKINLLVLLFLGFMALRLGAVSYQRTHFTPAMFLTPPIAFSGYILWSIGFLVGFVRGKQRF